MFFVLANVHARGQHYLSQILECHHEMSFSCGDPTLAPQVTPPDFSIDIHIYSTVHHCEGQKKTTDDNTL